MFICFKICVIIIMLPVRRAGCYLIKSKPELLIVRSYSIEFLIVTLVINKYKKLVTLLCHKVQNSLKRVIKSAVWRYFKMYWNSLNLKGFKAFQNVLKLLSKTFDKCSIHLSPARTIVRFERFIYNKSNKITLDFLFFNSFHTL